MVSHPQVEKVEFGFNKLGRRGELDWFYCLQVGLSPKSRMLIRFAPDQSGYPLENIVKKPESCVQRSLEKSGKKMQKWSDSWFKFKSMPVMRNLEDSSKET